MTSPQFVVLKMDDLATGWWREWKTLADLVRAEHVRIGFGIFAASLEEGDAAYDAWIADVNGDDRFELWFHGYTGNGPNGEPGREHQGTPYEYQKVSFEKSRQALLTRCDTIMRTYSEHWHGGDATTLKVFTEDPYLRVWMCWDWKDADTRGPALAGGMKHLSQSRMVTMECPDPENWQPGYVNFEEFRKEYSGHEQDPVIVIQGHPWSWTDTSNKEDRTGRKLDRWAEFRKILTFLKDRDAEFVTPYQHERIVRGYAADTTPPTAPAGLVARRDGGNLALNWEPAVDAGSGVDCYKIQADGKPIGLSMTTTWTGPAAGAAYSVVAVDRAELSSPSSAEIRITR